MSRLHVSTPDEQELDSAAMQLCRGYSIEGIPAFIIRSLPSGSVRVIGLQLPRALVVQMLRDAADAWAEQAPDEGPTN